MTLFYRKSYVGWPLGVPESYHPSLEIPEKRANFPIFLWQKSPGKYSDRSSQSQSLHLNPSPALPEFSQGTHLWDQRGGRKSLSGLFPKKAWGFCKTKGEKTLDNKSSICYYKPHSSCSLLVSYNHAVS